MSAPAEPLKPSLEQARSLAALERRIQQLNDQLAEKHRINEVLRGQLADRTHERDAARRNVADQQAEYSANRPRRVPLPHPRPAVRDVPTGGHL